MLVIDTFGIGQRLGKGSFGFGIEPGLGLNSADLCQRDHSVSGFGDFSGVESAGKKPALAGRRGRQGGKNRASIAVRIQRF